MCINTQILCFNKSVLSWTFCQLLVKNPIAQKHDMTDPQPKHLVAFLMSLCNARFTATQFALLSSLMAFSRDILVAPAGVLAEAIGWQWFFLITVIAALPGLALLPLFAPWQEQD